MENLAGPRLLQAFFDHATNDVLSDMSNPSKAALRLSCKNAKAFLDGAVTTAAGDADALDAILRCDWRLSKLYIEDEYPILAAFLQDAFTSSLHAVCSKFPMLQALEINAPRAIYDLPANIGQLSKLSVLKVTRAHFSALPPSFRHLSSLERLELCAAVSASQLTIEGLAPMKQLTQLKHLKLNQCLVSEPFFPTWLGSCHFPVLEDLILAGRWLSLPPSISNFKNLTALTIKENSSSLSVPKTIGSLHLLKKLCLGCASGIVNLPASFSKLTTLEQLGVMTDMENFALVHANKLRELTFLQKMEEGVIMRYPAFLWTFTSLQTLKLIESAVPSLPDALGNLEKLKVLHLARHQRVEQLPETIGYLTCMTQLKISDCFRLSKLPESIGNLKHLRELEIIGCSELRTLPESIGDLQRLEMLNLDQIGRINSLPLSIGNLHALKVLTVGNAGRFNLPETFADLVLDKPIEHCSLEKVSFIGNTKFVISGPRSRLALGILQERGVLECNNGFSFS
jgi:hypothetical protein